MKLLVVGRKNIYKMICSFYEGIDIKIINATNATDAIYLSLEENPDIVVMESYFDGESGAVVAQKFETNRRLNEIPIVFVMPKDTDNKTVTEIIEKGHYQYIEFPFEGAEIKALLDSVYSKKIDEQAKWKKSVTDNITGVYNKKYFLEKLSYDLEESERKEEPISVAVIDVDNFKLLNKMYGDEAGDFILKEFAERLKKWVREYDFISRFDNDEFAIMFMNCDRMNTYSILSRMKDDLGKTYFNFNSKVINIMISRGIADNTEIESDDVAQGVLKMAMERLMKAKEKGGDRVEI